MEHKFGASCLNSGIISCRVILDHGGYVPGETILVSALIRNRSKVHIQSTKASLREVQAYYILYFMFTQVGIYLFIAKYPPRFT